MSVKCILQGQSQSTGMKYNSLDDLVQLLPEVPDKPVQMDEEIPYTWEQINAIVVTGQTSQYIEVGAVKTIQLDYPLLDTQDLVIRYIGLDIDRSNENSIEYMIFQTECLNRPISYIKVDTRGDVVSVLQGWKNSNVRQKCQEFYQALPFKNYIQSLNKGTCYEISEDRGARVSYNKELVWLLSEQEMGGDQYSPLAISNANKEWGEATFGRGEEDPYEYYTLGDYKKRKQPYWLRSNAYDSFKGACIITDTGEFNVEDGRSEYGFAPAFAIGVMQGNITQNEEDITSKVSDAIGLAQHIGDTGNPHNVTAFQIGAVSQVEFQESQEQLNSHTSNSTIHVTSTEKNKIAKAVTTSGVVYNSALPAKPSAPIADGQEIPYSWEEINAITLAGKAQEYFSLGATKLVNLSTAVLGANAATMMVIGFNQDGENTTTFQTAGALPTYTTFGSDAVWIGSTARTQCQNFYNACEAKSFIKTVSKGTCPNQVFGKNGTATYNDETVWIPSETEMGLDNYSSLTKSNSTTSNSECTKGYNAGYSYYASNTTRIKYQMNADGTLTTSTVYYWERSRYYGVSNYVCNVGTGGSVGNVTCYAGDGFAPAFVIGNEEALAKDTLIQDDEDVTDKVKEIVKPTVEEIGAASLAAMAKKPDAVQERLTVHVAKTGSDATGDGSEAKPYLTIQKALDSLPRLLLMPTTVLVQAGTYDETVNIVRFTGDSLRLAGADDATVSLKGIYVLDCHCCVNPYHLTLTGHVDGKFHLGIWSNRADYLLVEKVTCTFENKTASPYGAIRFEYCLEGMLADSTVSNQAIAVDVLASNVYLRQLAGTDNTVAVRCGSGEGALGGFVQKGYQVTITGEEQKGYGGQIW